MPWLVRFVEGSRGEVAVTMHDSEADAVAKAWAWVEFVADDAAEVAAWRADPENDCADWRAAFADLGEGRSELTLDQF